MSFLSLHSGIRIIKEVPLSFPCSLVTMRYSFQIIYKGSEFLIDEFPNSKDYYEETGDKIEKI